MTEDEAEDARLTEDARRRAEDIRRAAEDRASDLEQARRDDAAMPRER